MLETGSLPVPSGPEPALSLSKGLDFETRDSPRSGVRLDGQSPRSGHGLDG